MSPLTVDQFATLTVEWAKARNSQFKYNWPVKGGWEGWVQVDLTGYILAMVPTAEILREQPIYTEGRRVDLLLNDTLPGKDQIPVEIKAESFENRANFIPGLLQDLTKINDGRIPAYRESTCVALAIPFSPESMQQVEAIEVSGYRIFRRIYVGEVACLVAVCVGAVWQPVTGAELAGHGASGRG